MINTYKIGQQDALELLGDVHRNEHVKVARGLGAVQGLLRGAKTRAGGAMSRFRNPKPAGGIMGGKITPQQRGRIDAAPTPQAAAPKKHPEQMGAELGWNKQAPPQASALNKFDEKFGPGGVRNKVTSPPPSPAATQTMTQKAPNLKKPQSAKPGEVPEAPSPIGKAVSTASNTTSAVDAAKGVAESAAPAKDKPRGLLSRPAVRFGVPAAALGYGGYQLAGGGAQSPEYAQQYYGNPAMSGVAY